MRTNTKDFHYREIVKHNNYTPRIMEFVTREYNFKKVSSGHYYEYVLRCLDNPTEIWQDEFSEKLQQEDRVFLTTLYSLTDTSIDENVVKRAFIVNDIRNFVFGLAGASVYGSCKSRKQKFVMSFTIIID